MFYFPKKLEWLVDFPSEIELHQNLGMFLLSLKNPLPTSAYVCLGDDAVYNLLLRYVQTAHTLHTGGLHEYEFAMLAVRLSTSMTRRGALAKVAHAWCSSAATYTRPHSGKRAKTASYSKKLVALLFSQMEHSSYEFEWPAEIWRLRRLGANAR